MAAGVPNSPFEAELPVLGIEMYSGTQGFNFIYVKVVFGLIFPKWLILKIPQEAVNE
ncbi:hypothetical protein GCM10012279_57470 [Micromonospora yangpuensis]|uniref:Uncharacterized protein n=1 Tax=Micromonospora yangpuensis TaxID=683228 RepID=A0A1C6VGD7_9ACTN|nr:hypothetical protein GCM10012279_57470 [Micromonospora yangpuensis]SCL65134.1 hypothetical protein GA0070617_5669 [Micromonospora yangpuensis]